MANILNKNEQLIIGINWGGAKINGWFGSIEYMMADLDLNILIVDKVTMNIKEVVNNKNTSKAVFDKGIIIEKDDNYGDLSGNDGKDNEWGIINLEHLSPNHLLIPIIYNYSKVIWNELSHLEFRIYYGEPNCESRLVYFKNLKDLKFESKDILLPGRIYQKSNEWYFENFDFKEKKNLLNTMEILNQLRIPF